MEQRLLSLPIEKNSKQAIKKLAEMYDKEMFMD